MTPSSLSTIPASTASASCAKTSGRSSAASTNATVGRDDAEAYKRTSWSDDGKRAHPIADQIVSKVPRDREGEPRRTCVSAQRGSRDLQREERVPSRCLRQARERRRWQPDTEARPHELGQFVDRERHERESRDAFLRQRAREPQRERRPHPACRDQPADRVVAEPANGELQRANGRDVEPLDVVERHEDGTTGRRLPQDGQRRRVHRARIGRRPRRRRTQQRDLECGPLRIGEEREQVAHSLQQIGETREGKRRLGLGGADRQHAPAPIERPTHTSVPERRLPDPRRPVQHERRRPVHQPVQERIQPRELVLPPDDVRPTRRCIGSHRELHAPLPVCAGQTPAIPGGPRVLEP